MSSFGSKIYAGNLVVGISDHMPQVAIICNDDENTTKTSFISQQDWAKLDENKFNNEIKSIDWDKIICIDQNDPDISFGNFYKKMNSLTKLIFQGEI